MNIDETEETAFELTEAIGPDFIQLAPRGEGHLDTAELAIHISYVVMTAVGSGIVAGITEWSKTKTVDLLNTISGEISKRLTSFIHTTFSKIHTPQVQQAALQDAAATMRSAHDASQQLDESLTNAVIAASSSSIRNTLEELGLNARSAERVEVTLTQRLSISLGGGDQVP
jgi:hypothetical protein